MTMFAMNSGVTEEVILCQLMIYSGLECSHCISSCWRKRLRVGVAFLVQQAGEKAVTRGKDIFPKVSDKE